jgi:hypothetical protein
MKHTGKIAIICFLLAFIFLYMLLSVNGLAQEEPEALGITPYIWIEHKFYEWDGKLVSYYVGGWWFEDGDYYHVGDWRDFKVNKYIYSNILRPWADGNIARICKLGFKDYDNFASEFFCWPSFQSFLPFIE